MKRPYLALFLSACVSAQQPEASGAPKPPAAPKPAEAKKPTVPPELAEYSEASRIKDPAKRLEALKALIAKYPDKAVASAARSRSVSTAVELYSKDKAALLAAVKQQADGATKVTDQIAIHRMFASTLLDKKLFPEEAVKAANRAFALIKREAIAAEMIASAKAYKMPAPAESTIQMRYDMLLGPVLDTRGQALWKTGKLGAAAKSFQSALQLDPANGSAAFGLASIEEKRNHPKEALHYATLSMLGKATPESRKKLEELYAKNHNGSLSGLEAHLDANYPKMFPAPVHAEKYVPGAKRSSRTVLAEVHTGAGCPPCVAADLAFDALMERYNRDELVVLMYHQHIPRPDPMANADTKSRWDFVAGDGVPTFVIDGKNDGGGGPRSETKSTMARIEKKIGPALEREAGATLRVESSGDEREVRVKVVIPEIKVQDAQLQLRVALVERLVKYSGENGIRYHPNVVRNVVSIPVKSAGTSETSFQLSGVQAKLEEHIRAFETKDERHNPDGTFRFMAYAHTIDPANLGVVVYLEDEKKKDVLQAAWSEVKSTPRISRRDP